MSIDTIEAKVPSWRLREEAEKRRALEARIAVLERESIELKATVRALEGVIDRLTCIGSRRFAETKIGLSRWFSGLWRFLLSSRSSETGSTRGEPIG